MRDTVTITVPVDSAVAEYDRAASYADRRKIELLVNLHLRDMMKLVNKRQEGEAARGECCAADLGRWRAELIANLGLQDVPESARTPEEIMDENSNQAQQRGLTWETLQSIFDEGCPGPPGRFISESALH